MRYRITSDAQAIVTLTAREAEAVRTRRVPMIYGSGGMGPHTLPEDSNVTEFSGACFVDTRAKLVEALGLFRAALAASKA